MGSKLGKETGTEETSRKPNGSNFHQQKLKAWQPILTASTILPLFFAIGIVFIPIGIALLATSGNIKEKIIEYSSNDKCSPCEEKLKNFTNGIAANCKCEITFNLTSKWDGNVFFYYGLSDFYQNHRRYVRSYDANQLHGQLSKSVSSDCGPFDQVGKGANNGTTAKVIAPCGAIANSMFTDVFRLQQVEGKTDVPLSYKNIAWKSDREVKFKNPPGDDLREAFKGYAKPPYWTKPVYELDTKNKENNGFQNQDFIVWMRVAAFPTFRKLYRKLDRSISGFKDGLAKGEYKLSIDYNYPVATFNGKKRFILTTTSWMGGKNPFLGIAYIVVGCLCLMFGFVFLIIHLKVRNGQSVISDSNR